VAIPARAKPETEAAPAGRKPQSDGNSPTSKSEEAKPPPAAEPKAQAPKPAAKAETAKPESVRADKPEHEKSELSKPPKSESSKSEAPSKSGSSKSEPTKSEASKSAGPKSEHTKSDPKTEGRKAEGKAESSKSESVKPAAHKEGDGAKADQAKVSPAKATPSKSDAGKSASLAAAERGAPVKPKSELARLSVTLNTASTSGGVGDGRHPPLEPLVPCASEHRSGARSAGECSVSSKDAVTSPESATSLAAKLDALTPEVADRASPKLAVLSDPGGERHVHSSEKADTHDGSTTDAASCEVPTPSKVGKSPGGAPAAGPDNDVRRQIAGGPTADDLSAPKNDPELRALSEAERVLFPKPLRGARVGWSWDLPTPVDDGSAAVETSGLPPAMPLGSAARKEAAKEAEWLRALVMPNLPTRLDSRVVKYLKFYRDDARGRSIARNWAKKAGRFAPALKAEFAKAGLPTDLVWLSLIESGHNPTIVSPVGAAGLWQFVPESARMYGLTVDRWVDERLDPVRSTEAAVRYLSDLRARFGSYELAMAAYNMGHGGLLRAVRKFNTNDFWALSRYEAGVPWETTLYVPKILATAILMANKKAFGVDDVDPDPPISFDTVYVGPNVDLADVARAADVPLDDVRALNAHYLTQRTPPFGGSGKQWPVRVPAGHGLLAGQRLASAARPPGTGPEPYVVRFGDTLEAIAGETGASVREIMALNHVAPDERLIAGSVLVVPRSPVAADVAAPADEQVVVVPARRFGDAHRRRVFYEVLPGDTVADIAAAFGVAPSELVTWNGLDESALLQQGMTLQVFVPEDRDLSRTRYLADHEARVLVAGSREFFEYFEAQNGRKRITVVAKKGDTLASIGKRYGMSTAMMERINRFPASGQIREGDRIVVYAKGDVPNRPVPDAVGELSAVLAPLPEALPPLPETTEASSSNGLPPDQR
jgi:membrane-bound lytic murein transglycosylase D